jgi:uncharacterized protein
MKYAAIVTYTPDASVIAKARPAHRQYLIGLKEQNKLVISGPFADDRGGLLVYEAETPSQVEALIAADPFATQGVFLSWEIRPWNVVMINSDLLCK